MSVRSVLVTDAARVAVTQYLAVRDDPPPPSSSGSSRPQEPRGSTGSRLGALHLPQARRRARDPGVPPHRLRHTLGTVLQEQLGDARLTAETLGHAGLASVAGYTRITERRRRQALEAVEAAGL